MTYDSEDQVVVLFGGSVLGHPAALNDTWTYAGGLWTNASVSAPPPIFGEFGLGVTNIIGFADDPAAGYVLYEFSDPLALCPSHPKYCPLTWTYRGGVWTNRTAAEAESPVLSEFSTFTYDSSAGAVVAQAFCTSTPNYTCLHEQGTFAFSGGAWKDVTPPTEPAARLFTSGVDDPSDGGLMLLGGCCWADFSGVSLGWEDLWIFSHGSWTEFEPWGGGTPSWGDNDGAWIGFGTLSVAVVVVAYALRQSASRRHQHSSASEIP
jgi:hypothetical protein